MGGYAVKEDQKLLFLVGEGEKKMNTGRMEGAGRTVVRKEGSQRVGRMPIEQRTYWCAEQEEH